MKTRFNLGEDRIGWEYEIGDLCIVRKFDNGEKVYFFNSKTRNYTVYVDKDDCNPSRYTLSIVVILDDGERIEQRIYGKSRKELFKKTRQKISNLRKMVSDLPF